MHRLIIAPPHIITAPALATAVTALLVGAQWGCRLGVAHRFLHPPVRPALVVADAQDTANVSARNVSSLRSFLLVFLSLSLIIIHTTIHIPLSNYYVKLRQTALLASHPPPYTPTRFPSQQQTRPIKIVAAQLPRPLTTRHANPPIPLRRLYCAIAQQRPSDNLPLPRRCCCCCVIARALCWHPASPQRPTTPLCLCLPRLVASQAIWRGLFVFAGQYKALVASAAVTLAPRLSRTHPQHQ